MAEDFDDYEMQDLGSKYPEYNDMDDSQLHNEYDTLTNERLNLLRDGNANYPRLREVQERMDRISEIKKSLPSKYNLMTFDELKNEYDRLMSMHTYKRTDTNTF